MQPTLPITPPSVRNFTTAIIIDGTNDVEVSLHNPGGRTPQCSPVLSQLEPYFPNVERSSINIARLAKRRGMPNGMIVETRPAVNRARVSRHDEVRSFSFVPGARAHVQTDRSTRHQYQLDTLFDAMQQSNKRHEQTEGAISRLQDTITRLQETNTRFTRNGRRSPEEKQWA
jgi:hypothetical protein